MSVQNRHMRHLATNSIIYLRLRDRLVIASYSFLYGVISHPWGLQCGREEVRIEWPGGNARSGPTGQWHIRTSTGQDGSIEFDMERIGPTVAKIQPLQMRCTDGRIGGRTDVRTNGRTETIYSPSYFPPEWREAILFSTHTQFKSGLLKKRVWSDGTHIRYMTRKAGSWTNTFGSKSHRC